MLASEVPAEDLQGRSVVSARTLELPIGFDVEALKLLSVRLEVSVGQLGFGTLLLDTDRQVEITVTR